MSCYIHKDENAIYYECGYSCDNAIFLSIEEEKFFITDSRYKIDVEDNTKDIQIIIAKNLIQELCSILENKKIKNISLNPSEWSYFEVSRIQKIDININLVNKMSQQKRIIKSDDEVELLREAVRLGSIGFDKFAHYIQESGLGQKESELALNNYIQMSNFGELNVSFDAIVAINENSAKPHALPTNKILNNNDTLLVDAGIKYKRYCSDRTRTVQIKEDFAFDYNQKFSDKKKQNIFDTVLKAHDKCIEKYQYGMRACDIDKIARDVIDKAGFGDFFIHSTGHGVGLDIHELPFITSTDESVIEENMVFTIEPGIYVKDFIGVRIEDMVVMKNKELEIL